MAGSSGAGRRPVMDEMLVVLSLESHWTRKAAAEIDPLRSYIVFGSLCFIISIRYFNSSQVSFIHSTLTVVTVEWEKGFCKLCKIYSCNFTKKKSIILFSGSNCVIFKDVVNILWSPCTVPMRLGLVLWSKAHTEKHICPNFTSLSL